jgi:hypothetical protein
MPYDARLDGSESPSPGTAADFASRALRDFVTFILPNLRDASCGEHAAAVSRRLKTWTATVRPERKRQSDAELLGIIRSNWNVGGASVSRMLRWVRSDLGLACEQGRMRELYRSVQREMEAAP